MKKLLAIAFVCSTLPVFAFGDLPVVPITTTSPMSDMQTIEDQKFRDDQINYYDDGKTKKSRFKRRAQTEEESIQDVRNQIQQSVDNKVKSYGKSRFIRENGQIKIKYGN